MKKQQAELQRQKSFKFKFQRKEKGIEESSGENNMEKVEICKKYTT
jgi:hypothetical protein